MRILAFRADAGRAIHYFSLSTKHLRICLSFLILAGLGVQLCSCAKSKSRGPRLGERIIPLGKPVPKGGGVYKVGSSYNINGQLFRPQENERYDRVGTASWYGEMFHGRYTANGEIYDMDRLTAAHPTLPMPVYARVTNLKNNRTIVVRINDRGPYARGREIDLSRRSALALGFMRQGTAPVRVTYMGKAPLSGDDSYERRVLASQGLTQVASADKSDGIKTASLPGPKQRALGRDDAVTIVAKTPRIQTANASSRRTSDGTRTANAPARRTSDGVQTASVKTVSISMPKPEAAIQTSRLGGLIIQAGSFKSRDNADRAKRDLASVAPVQVDTVEVAGEPFYRVRIGPFADRAAAESALARVKSAGHNGARVVSLDAARG